MIIYIAINTITIDINIACHPPLFVKVSDYSLVLIVSVKKTERLEV
ncbi:MAG: hypothetical protein ACRDBM_03770 [Sporomusa sp.]